MWFIFKATGNQYLLDRYLLILRRSRRSVNKQIEQDQHNNELTVICLGCPVRGERYQGTKVTRHTLSRHTH